MGTPPEQMPGGVEIFDDRRDLLTSETLALDRLEDLTPEERAVIELMSQDLSRTEIALRLSMTPSTMARKATTAFNKLGITADHQLGTILFNEDEVLEPNLDLLDISERKVFDYISAGLSYKQIASELSVPDGSIRRVATNIRQNLGLAGTVDLYRVAHVHALRRERAKVDSTALPAVRESIKQTHNSRAFQNMIRAGFLDMVTIRSLIKSRLKNYPDVKPLLDNPETINLIRKEVAAFAWLGDKAIVRVAS